MDQQDKKLRKCPTTPHALLWSDAGQVAVIASSRIYILTPAFRSLAQKECKVTQLPELNQVAGEEVSCSESELAQYFSPEVYQCASWSPPAAFDGFGSLLAVTTTKNRAFIYGPREHPHNSTWNTLIHDFASSLKRIPGHNSSESLESTAIAWSKPCIFYQRRSPISMIALGNKNGGVTLWSFYYKATYSCEFNTQVNCVKALAWSPWRPIDQTSCISYLATANLDGTVNVWAIVAKLEQEHKNTIPAAGASITLTRKLSSANGRCPTLLQWLPDTQSNEPILRLVVVTGNHIFLYILTLEEDKILARDVDVRIYNIPLSMPISAISWDPINERLVLVTLDGKMRILTVLPDHQLQADETESSGISQLITSLWQNIKIEDENSENEDDEGGEGAAKYSANAMQLRFWGIDTSENGAFISVAYSVANVKDIEYKSDKHFIFNVSFRASTQLQLGTQHWEKMIKRLRDRVTHPDLAVRSSSINTLWEILELTQSEPGAFLQIAEMLREIYLVSNSAFSEPILSENADLNDRLKQDLIFKQQWMDIFYGDAGISAIQLMCHLNTRQKQMSVQDTALLTSNSTLLTDAAKRDNEQLLIRHHVKSILTLGNWCIKNGINITHSTDFMILICACDFALKYGDQEDRNLQLLLVSTLDYLDKIPSDRKLFQDLERERKAAEEMKTREKGAPVELPSHENCPACDTGIVTSSPKIGVCGNGHMWERCSITLTLLLERNTQFCLGCPRKACAPLQDDKIKGDTQPVLMNALLEICKQCLYCGSMLSGKMHHL
ncbi:uncharacterized protein VTP21DRAFT_7847 [Calcarisporiella thermophila]|uniref:uncharacterized protein n=1 Tax=Calcarisporiella thermophila TaxID=911321 RepID=UPI00374220D1